MGVQTQEAILKKVDRLKDIYTFLTKKRGFAFQEMTNHGEVTGK